MASKAILIFLLLVSGFLVSFFLPTVYPFPQVAAPTPAGHNLAIRENLRNIADNGTRFAFKGGDAIPYNRGLHLLAQAHIVQIITNQDLAQPIDYILCLISHLLLMYHI
jgi:hypothetical protein